MMIFHVGTLDDLKIRAQLLWNTLKHRDKNGYTAEMQVAFIVGHFQEICELGYGIRSHEVSSTPWEYAVSYASSQTVEKMNEMSAEGWEFLCPFDGSKILWRRYKAVGEMKGGER